jgi:hypothetical protein
MAAKPKELMLARAIARARDPERILLIGRASSSLL